MAWQCGLLERLHNKVSHDSLTGHKPPAAVHVTFTKQLVNLLDGRIHRLACQKLCPQLKE